MKRRWHEPEQPTGRTPGGGRVLEPGGEVVDEIRPTESSGLVSLRCDPVRRVLLAAAGVSSVVPLLAWVYGLGSFRSWFLPVALPGALVMMLLATGRLRTVASQRVVRLGVIAGLIGTAGYDLFRVPFVFGAGFRLLSPIESYGVLLLGADSSSGASDLTGWSWHVANGIGFAITYLALFEGRRWWWGLVWAAMLETATVVTPFADMYALRGNVTAIVIAYAAHVPFGVAVGLVGQHSRELSSGPGALSHLPAGVPLAAVALALVGWLQPLRSHDVSDAPGGVNAAVVGGRMHPEFVRIAPSTCATVVNLDPVGYRIDEATAAPLLGPGEMGSVCFDDPGIHRIRVDDEPFHGGFMIVDPALASSTGEPARDPDRR